MAHKLHSSFTSHSESNNKHSKFIQIEQEITTTIHFPTQFWILTNSILQSHNLPPIYHINQDLVDFFIFQLSHHFQDHPHKLYSPSNLKPIITKCLQEADILYL